MLTLRDLYKSYSANQPVLKGVDLTVERGEIVCLLGPSGCGKTTLLRLVAGLESADRGEILMDGKDLTQVPVHQRNFGFMFQEFALFPHRNVAENIGFGLRMAGANKAEIATRVEEMLELVNLGGYGKRSIFELSGGERQRVALARSLAPHPHLLLLDEPLGSLDRALREELMNDLRVILKKIDQTVLFVTHDQQEALAIADRIAIMNQGLIEQIDQPQQIYQHPANAFVARFLGFQNLLPARVSEEKREVAQTTIGDLPLPAPVQPGHYTLLIRPTALRVGESGRQGDAPRGKIESLSYRGEATRLELSFPDTGLETNLIFSVPSTFSFHVGDQIRLSLQPDQLQLL
ncbi:MAG: ABC transporter ATP-binding protein [Caldilineaceae bacterium]